MVSKGTKTPRGGKGVAKRAPKKVADEQLRDYELALVISPEVAEEKIDATIDNLSRLFTDMGGVVSEVKQWRKRRLAYPIKHFSEGNYVLTQLRLKPTSCRELEAKLQISEDVLRHLLIRSGS